ncbi:unnamed protein product [Blepharisma stoltei]|uniref:Photosystem I assembly protein Ycf4 n=1 Tax=Blepharisma stoltei TaxID=1481888 RepID=A0AAU9KFQ3_9CILI|nr:unnamed protein product [Blepharisma stoltei]
MAVHIQIIIGLTVMCFFGVIVLVPIYSQGDQTEGSIILKTGISNVLDDESYFVASIVFFIFFSLLGYSLVYIVLKTVSIKAHPNNIRNFNYVLEISGLPRQEAIDKIYDILKYNKYKPPL